MTIKSVIAGFCVASAIASRGMAQPINKFTKGSLRETLVTKCDDSKKKLHNIKNSQEYENYTKNIIISDIPERCKDEKHITMSYSGIKREGSDCYILDKLDKVDDGGIVVIETHQFNIQSLNKLYPALVKLYAVKNMNLSFLVMSPEKASEKTKEIFNNPTNNPSATFFALGDKEVPDFDRALYSLKKRSYPDKIPSDIIRAAILNDTDLTKKDKQYLLEHLKETDTKEYVKTSPSLHGALKKTLNSIENDCFSSDQKHLVKGLSLTGTSAYEFQKWDIAPLKQWISDNKKDEL
jgi:hypothetical protein